MARSPMACAAANAGQRQRGRVGHTEMATSASEEGRAATGSVVQLLPGRVTTDVETAIVVTPPQQPALPLRRRGRRRGGPEGSPQSGQSRDRRRPGVDQAEAQSIGDGMGVIVIEPGQKGASLQINHPRLRPNLSANLVI